MAVDAANGLRHRNANNAWREILIALRSLLLATELKEEMKWGFPPIPGKNAASSPKSHCTCFFKGAAMQDPEASYTRRVPTRYARYLKFQNSTK